MLEPLTHDKAKAPVDTSVDSDRERRVIDFYLTAKECVVKAGFGREIDWQENLTLARVSEVEFLREQAWVVLSSGMRATVIAQVFEGVTNAFCNWDAARIKANVSTCIARALKSFGHVGKIRAIAANCERLVDEGLDALKGRLLVEGPTWLTRFAYVGPVTCWHLAKNLGLDVVKPDRHLVRMTDASGMRDPHQLCEVIAKFTGDRLSVVDVVLWRYATVTSDYAEKMSRTRQQPGRDLVGRACTDRASIWWNQGER